jgi:hypothetical protein
MTAGDDGRIIPDPRAFRVLPGREDGGGQRPRLRDGRLLVEADARAVGGYCASRTVRAWDDFLTGLRTVSDSEVVAFAAFLRRFAVAIGTAAGL